jgi:hypothetical protein
MNEKEVRDLIKSLKGSIKQARAIDRSELLHEAAIVMEQLLDRALEINYWKSKCEMLSMFLDPDESE